MPGESGISARFWEDPRIQLVVSAAISSERGPLGVAAMRHGKDYMSDKPAFTTLEQLAAALGQNGKLSDGGC